MALLYGFNSFMRIGKESVYGTAQTATTQDIRIISGSLQTAQGIERKTHLSTPTSGMQAGTFQAFRTAGGSFDIPVHYDGIGVLLEAALGSVSSSGVSDPYTHTYSPDFDLPSMTIQYQRGTGLTNSMEQFTGCKVSSMSISCEAGQECTASFEIIGQDGATRTTDITASLPATDGVFHHEAGSLTMGGSLTIASLDIISFELSLDNKLDRRNVLGSKLTGEPVITDVREVTLSITADVTDNSILADQLAQNSGDVYIEFTRTADTNHKFKILLTSAIIDDYSDPVTAYGRVQRTFTLRGIASSVNNGLTITVINANSDPRY